MMYPDSCLSRNCDEIVCQAKCSHLPALQRYKSIQDHKSKLEFERREHDLDGVNDGQQFLFLGD